MTLQKVRQLQQFVTFYNGMYRFLQYEHLPKNKLLARKIKLNKDGYIVDNELIYHLWNKRLNRHIYKQLCIARELRLEISRLLNNTRFTWHRGVHKMYEDAIRHFSGIIYIKTCKTMCQVVNYA